MLVQIHGLLWVALQARHIVLNRLVAKQAHSFLREQLHKFIYFRLKWSVGRQPR